MRFDKCSVGTNVFDTNQTIFVFIPYKKVSFYKIHSKKFNYVFVRSLAWQVPPDPQLWRSGAPGYEAVNRNLRQIYLNLKGELTFFFIVVVFPSSSYWTSILRIPRSLTGVLVFANSAIAVIKAVNISNIRMFVH